MWKNWKVYEVYTDMKEAFLKEVSDLSNKSPLHRPKQKPAEDDGVVASSSTLPSSSVDPGLSPSGQHNTTSGAASTSNTDDVQSETCGTIDANVPERTHDLNHIARDSPAVPDTQPGSQIETQIGTQIETQTGSQFARQKSGSLSLDRSPLQRDVRSRSQSHTAADIVPHVRRQQFQEKQSQSEVAHINTSIDKPNYPVLRKHLVRGHSLPDQGGNMATTTTTNTSANEFDDKGLPKTGGFRENGTTSGGSGMVEKPKKILRRKNTPASLPKVEKLSAKEKLERSGAMMGGFAEDDEMLEEDEEEYEEEEEEALEGATCLQKT